MRRRAFLIASSMSAALTLASRAGAGIAGSGIVGTGSEGADLAGSAVPLPVDAFIYEARYPLAYTLARQEAERGVRAFAMEGCMVQLWRGPLGELLSGAGSPARIAGVTLYSDFTIARDCARERGLRVLNETWCRDCNVSLVSWLIGA
jgi:hypothetical protein